MKYAVKKSSLLEQLSV